jgi:hypothetical protein
MHAIGFRVLFAALLLMYCIRFFLPPSAHGGPVTGTEYEVKAGFIYNFANFVAWPQEAFQNSPDTLVLCYFSDNPESSTLKKLEGKTIKGKVIQVLDLNEGDCIDTCHILFLGTQDEELIRQFLDRAKGRSILTIGEVEGFTRMGGVINFFEEQNRLRFKVNLDAAQKADLKMSSQLLLSAQIVHGENE